MCACLIINDALFSHGHTVPVCACVQSQAPLTSGECGVIGDMCWNRHAGHGASCSAVTSFCAPVTRHESLIVAGDYYPKRRPSRAHSLWYDVCWSLYVHTCLVFAACMHLKHIWVHTCIHTRTSAQKLSLVWHIHSPPCVSLCLVRALPLYTLTNAVGAYYFNWYNIEDQWKRYSQTRHPVLGHYDQSVRKSNAICISCLYVRLCACWRTQVS